MKKTLVLGEQKAFPEREHQKSYVAVAFENAYKNDELWDSTAPGICCVKGVRKYYRCDCI